MLRKCLFFTAVFFTALAISGPWTRGANGQPVDKDAPATSSGAKAAVVVKRQSEATDEDLRKQLLTVTTTGFGEEQAASLYTPLKEAGSKVTNLPSDLGPTQFQAWTKRLRQPEQFGLPWRMEPDCSMGKESAERLHVLSLRLRDCLRKSAPTGDVRPDADKLKTILFADETKGKEWKTAPAIPTLMQLLQAENSPIRLLLVELLDDIDGKEASAALAQRALFDLAPEVREKAVQALAKRPAQQYQQQLVDGLRYPWPAAAEHAGEAIAALKLTQVTPDLVELLKEPDPRLPYKKNGNEYVVKELVRLNHLSNCMLCHAPSLAKADLIRGRMPMPGEDPPPLYYNETSGLFVRANTTYLRQDFSVVQPVANNGKWPANQRFDYVMRVRPLNPAEVRKQQQLEAQGELPKTFPQRNAVLFALREVTKADAGETYELWAKKLKDLPDLNNDAGQKKK